jgi:acyl-CoA thioester hydrolase
LTVGTRYVREIDGQEIEVIQLDDGFTGCLRTINQERIFMEFRIYYEDTDAGGVVYHARYLAFFERGRAEFFRDRGLAVGELAEQGMVFPVVRLEIDFKAPAVLDDLVRVETEVLEVGKTSFTVGQQVVRVFDGRLLVAGKVTLVCVGPGMKAKRLPEQLLNVLQQD